MVGTRFSGTSGMAQHLKKVLAILFMWIFLSRSVLGNMQRSLFSAPVLTLFHYFVIPQKFLFSYVNFTLITLFSLSSLLQEKKDIWYDLYAGIVVFPIALVGWMEGYFCLDFVLSFGGHVLYDGWICAGNMIFLAVAFAFTEPTKKKKSLTDEQNYITLLSSSVECPTTCILNLFNNQVNVVFGRKTTCGKTTTWGLVLDIRKYIIDLFHH